MTKKNPFNAVSGMPDTAFFDHVRAGDVAAVKNLLATRPAAVHWQQTSSGQRALHTVAMTGHCQMGAELIKAGAEVEARDHHGRTPLAQAARSGQQNIVDLLLQEKADIHAQDKKGNTPLHLAAEGISADTILMLIARGADATRRNNDGATPIDLAIAGGNKAMAAVIRREAEKRAAAGVPETPVVPETVRDIDLMKPLNPRKRTPKPD